MSPFMEFFKKQIKYFSQITSGENIGVRPNMNVPPFYREVPRNKIPQNSENYQKQVYIGVKDEGIVRRLNAPLIKRFIGKK